MVYCPTCGTEVTAVARFCSQCATPLTSDGGPSESSPRQQSSRRWLPLALTGLIVAIVATAVVGGVIFATSGSGEDSEPVRQAPAVTIRPTARAIETGPLLTGGQAAGKVEAAFRETAAYDDFLQTGGNVLCSPEDYNDLTATWILLCVLTVRGNTLTVRAEVDDRTGAVSILQ